MNVNFLNPFIEAASEVIQSELQTAVQRGSLKFQKSAFVTNDLAVLLNLIGQVQGIVLYEMSTEMGLAIVSRVSGQAFDELDELAQSGVAEFGNVITGRATVKLAQAGFDTRISVPTLIQGKGAKISTFDFTRLIVPLQTEFGEVIIHLALRARAESEQEIERGAF